MNDDARVADRLNELADTAELMGDDATASRLRERAHRRRLDEMNRHDPAGPNAE